MTRARPWLRALSGGVVGTALMTAALAIETRLYGDDEPDRIIDYEGTDHVVIAVCRLVRRPVPSRDRNRRLVFGLVHWGYGSSVAVVALPIYYLVGSRTRTAGVLWAGCQTVALVAFPTLGETPPPWRWPPRVLVSSVVLHAIYASTAAAFVRPDGTRRPRGIPPDADSLLASATVGQRSSSFFSFEG